MNLLLRLMRLISVIRERCPSMTLRAGGVKKAQMKVLILNLLSDMIKFERVYSKIKIQ